MFQELAVMKYVVISGTRN